MKFTHNGWFLFCPIKMAGIETEAPTIAARWLVLEPWLTVNHWLQMAMIWMLTTIDPDYEPMFMFAVTGERRQ